MKVYIVTNNNGNIRGAYTTKERAERAREEYNEIDEMGGGWGANRIKEVEVEE